MKNRYGVPMNTYGHILPKASQIARIPRLSKEAKKRLRWLDWYESHGKNARLTCRHFGLSPDVFYRWKNRFNPHDLTTLEDDKITRTPHKVRQPKTDPVIEKRVKEIREEYPRWGKKKIWKIIDREQLDTSVSTVGRTLDRLRERGILKEPAIVVARIQKGKRRKQFRFHAIPKDWNYKPIDPGDLIQVDTVHVYPHPGERRYQFTACDYITKRIGRCAAKTITSRSAKKILDILEERFPFKIKAIQIDGGSEFKKEFELECQTRGIILFVLPPRSPKLNSMVERAQRTSREEIYDILDVPGDIEQHNQLLARQDYIYNFIRPHDSLDLLTPDEYYLAVINKSKCVRV
jgi:transposase InsO family protein